MFGYILPDKNELKVKEYNLYKAFYCGICKDLGKRYGISPRFLLNYDLLLLQLLADSISGVIPDFSNEGCIANPIKKKVVAKNTDGIKLSSDCLILLSYYKLKDNIQDDNFTKKMFSKIGCITIESAFKKAKKLRPNLENVIKKQMENQFTLEKKGCSNIDEACDPTSQMVANMAILTSDNINLKPQLFRFGLFLGKLIYVLDAVDDFEKDKIKNNYNMFINLNLTYEEMIQKSFDLCKFYSAELSEAYCKIPLLQNKEILDNIIYLGIPKMINNIKNKEKKNESI